MELQAWEPALVCNATGGFASLPSWQGRLTITVDSACQKEQGIDLPPQSTSPRLQWLLRVSLSLFYGICFPKMKPSSGKGAETNNNLEKVKVKLVGCGNALKGKVPFPSPKEMCPWEEWVPERYCRLLLKSLEDSPFYLLHIVSTSL